MNTTWYVFRLADGMLTGDKLQISSVADRDRQTPPGCGWISGVTNVGAQRVRLAPDDFGVANIPLLEDWNPPEPSGTFGVGWTWDDTAREWVSHETLDGFKDRLRRRAIAQLDGLDLLLARPTAEVLQAMVAGDTPPAAAVEKIRDVNAAKASLRQLMEAISAAATVEELETLKGDLG